MITQMAEMALAEYDFDARPRVVAIGGGHGLAACLRAIRTYAGSITAIVSVADDGGSSGRLTAGTGIPPPGDIRRCLLALTPARSVWSELFDFRFPGGSDDGGWVEGLDVSGHSLGNLILAALSDMHGSFSEGVSFAGRLLGAVGKVVPVADRPLVLGATIGGTRVSGQVAVSRTRGGISHIEVGPAGVTASPRATAAIEDADQIVIGPGSLFTSVIAALAVPGLAGAIDRSAGRLVAVMNLVTQDAETLGMSGRDHLQALRVHGGVGRRGTVVVDVSDRPAPDGLERVGLDETREWTVVRARVESATARWPEHDPALLGAVLAGLL